MSPSWAEVKETKRRIERRTSKNKGLRYRAPKRRSAEPKLCAFGKNTQKNCTKKDLHDPDNHDGVITHLEADILECKEIGEAHV